MIVSGKLVQLVTCNAAPREGRLYESDDQKTTIYPFNNSNSNHGNRHDVVYLSANHGL